MGGSKRASEWPISESWVSANWHEKGGIVHGALTRTHPSGKTAAALFEVDLADRGVVSVKKFTDAHPAEVQQELVRRSSDAAQMHVTEPELIAKLVRDARAYGEKRGHEQPKGIGDAMSLFPDVDPEMCPHTFLTGDPLDDEVTDEIAKGGLWSSFKRRVGLS